MEPQELDAARRQAYALRQSFQFVKAREVLQAALRSPAAELWYDLGKTEEESGRPEAAIKAYQAGIEQAQESGQLLLLAQLREAQGLAYQDLGEEEQAVECHEAALAILKQLPEKEAGLFPAKVAKHLGELYFDRGDTALARSHFRSALTLLQLYIGQGEGFICLEAATVALQLAGVEIRAGGDNVGTALHLIAGAERWLDELDQDDSIVEERFAEARFLKRHCEQIMNK
ncbi:tetratricopeptide repeat protein [Phaeodactylibacter luteus]|uniref:Tetratricopeptide repeat protein n=1 Tax=Phaeodactylibacter luteus TaxID=1564516 RepID=A0A5C6RYV8_9BACT|nr:tetratricopeptide repeat protein [Phaeodactylibacter luteus]TXB67578.1 tetratricopeptide repeat protein [Phaeodactylibacter luteus]